MRCRLETIFFSLIHLQVKKINIFLHCFSFIHTV
jgi:hypothetical protein